MNSPIVDAARENVLRWYTGKGREKAAAALDLLAASEDAGAWIPGASRKVWSVLQKANRAINTGRAFRNTLDTIGTYETPANQRGHEISFVLQFGHFWGRKTDIDFAAIRAACRDIPTAHAVDVCEEFITEFATITALMKRLDATRPKPVITYLGASPTVTNLLKSLGLDGTVATTVRIAPYHFEKLEIEVKGVRTWTWIIVMDWPANTVHGASRYNHNGAHAQCEACGHAIKVVDNWVPLLIDNAAGVPLSLFVGRDCAKTLFGIKVTGEFHMKADAS